MTEKLIVKNLVKEYDGEQVLKSLSFVVKEGEFLSVLGPSGCGKTTLLRILIGLESQTAGEILLDGKDISKLPASQRGMGIIFQNYALFPNMTVLENVEYALKIKPETKADSRKRAERTLDMIGMSDQLNKKPHHLSGGQQQRVAIARTLALNPSIVLLDEPISALDVENKEIMKRELKDIQKKFHSTMIYITHDQEEAFFLSDRIMVMSNGTIEQLDSPTEIYDNPHSRFVAGFIGEMNFLDEGGAVLAVRPEDIALRSASGAGMARIESVMPLGHYTQIILVRADGARLKVFIPKEQALGYIPGQTADYSFTRFKQFGAAQASA